MNSRARAYVLITTGCFVAALVVAVVTGGVPGGHMLLAACPWLALSLLAEALVVYQEHGTSGHLSFSAAVHTAAAIVLGPFMAAVIAAMGVVVVDGGRRKNPYNVALNASMLGAASGIGGLAYHALDVGGPDGARTAVALGALVVCRFLTNTVLFAGIVTVATGQPASVLVTDELWHNGLAGIGEGSLGVLLGIAVQHNLDYTLPFLLPLLAAIYVARANYEQLWSETHKALDTFVEVIDERDPSTARHSERVTGYVRAFCEYLGLDGRQTARLAEAARYHDLGKVVVDVATLSASRRLEPHELAAIRSHARMSARLLNAFAFAAETAPLVELHHERFDGRGYYGVPADQIPIEAHVLIIADSFDAMTSSRAYRPALTVEEAASEIRDKAGLQFHPALAAMFAAMMTGSEPSDALSRRELEALRAGFSAPTRLRPPRRMVAPGAGVWMLLAVTVPLAAMVRSALVAPGLAVGAICAACAAAMPFIARRGDPRTETVAAEALAAADRIPAAARAIVVDLACFERIRAAAGQLTAERTVAEAADALRTLAGTDGTVEQFGDDRFVLHVARERWHLVVRSIGQALSTIRVPGRAEPIVPRTMLLDGTDTADAKVA
jgi:HD-GYP domain-containing protein (c-di-GMP phosphodiesterase class II)